MNPNDVLLGDDYDVFRAALVAAVESGASGERKLLDALRSTQDEYRVAGIVAALGEVDGPDGAAVLRDIIGQPTDPLEVRTTALVALTKRQGVAASDVLLGCLAHPDEYVPGYALLGLASVGDDRAWGAVLSWLSGMLDNSPANPEHDFEDRALVAQADLVAAVSYLARHAADSWARQQPVVRLLRSRWDRLRGAEQRWLTVSWPACDPSRPEEFLALDATWFADWISRPMFSALFLDAAGT